jgi:hypothetical protein
MVTTPRTLKTKKIALFPGKIRQIPAKSATRTQPARTEKEGFTSRRLTSAAALFAADATGNSEKGGGFLG